MTFHSGDRVMEFLGVLIVAVFFLIGFFSSGTDSSASDAERQLDDLSDGFGGILVSDESMTRQEAEDAQARGELYDTYYR